MNLKRPCPKPSTFRLIPCKTQVAADKNRTADEYAVSENLRRALRHSTLLLKRKASINRITRSPPRLSYRMTECVPAAIVGSISAAAIECGLSDKRTIRVSWSDSARYGLRYPIHRVDNTRPDSPPPPTPLDRT